MFEGCESVCVCARAFSVFLCEWIDEPGLFSTGNSIQYPGITQNGNNTEKNVYMYVIKSLRCIAEINKTL